MYKKVIALLCFVKKITRGHILFSRAREKYYGFIEYSIIFFLKILKGIVIYFNLGVRVWSCLEFGVE